MRRTVSPTGHMHASRYGLRSLIIAIAVLIAPVGTFVGVFEAGRRLQGAQSAQDVPYKRTKDVIYGRAYGTALTMDVFEPANGEKNGAAVLVMVSGGWFSSPQAINPGFALPFVRRGYTVFQVVHGSQPKYTIPEILEHVRRAVRYVRANASAYGIDPDKIGVTGGSAGGHLSLMLGLAAEEGDPDAEDPVDRQPARVASVACFFPPTDFLNWGKPGVSVLDLEQLKFVWAAFDFREFNRDTGRFERVPEARVREILRDISPVSHVDKNDPPVLIIHGDADRLVPLQQSETLIKRLREAGVTAKLVVKDGAGHGWPDLVRDLDTCADWFDQYLNTRELNSKE